MTDRKSAGRVRAAMGTHRLRPTDDELAVYASVEPMLRQLVEQLYEFELTEES